MVAVKRKKPFGNFKARPLKFRQPDLTIVMEQSLDYSLAEEDKQEDSNFQGHYNNSSSSSEEEHFKF